MIRKSDAMDFLFGGGELGELMRGYDWSSTALGPIESWPQSLRSAISIMLPSKAQIVMFWGPEHIALYNSAYAPTIGDKHPGALGRPARENWAELWDILEPLLRSVLDSGEAFFAKDYPFRIERQGYLEEIYFDVSYAPVRSEDGSVAGIFCVVNETTGRVLSERRLRTLRELGFATTTETTVAEVCELALQTLAVSDPADVPFAAAYLLEEPGVATLVASFGAGLPESVRRILLGDGRADWVLPLAEVLSSGQPRDLDAAALLGRAPDTLGERLIVLPITAGKAVAGLLVAGLSPMLAPTRSYRDFLDLVAGRVSKGVTIARMLADERQRAAQLEEQVAQAVARHEAAEAQLHQAQKMEAVGKLTGGVAHDFNNLLQVISGNLQLLAKDLSGDPRAERRLVNALSAVQRGSKLASQLLAFGRRQPLEPKVVNLGRFVRSLDDMLRRAIGEEIEIETVVAGGLWNTLADPAQVENALLNLSINARDAMEGRGRLTIEAGNAFLDDDYASRHADVVAGQYVMLAVTDTGCGIPSENLEKVFDPFFSTKPEGQGTGLGLSMVYGFTKQSGGHVKIYSEPGHGTTVRIYLPRSAEAEDSAPAVDTGPVKGGMETILVVEDDENVRATVVEMLGDLGYRVLKAGDAQSALVIVESGLRIDLLFTDVVMPGPLRSPDLARKARERQPEIAVLFTSGYTENAIVHGGRLDEGTNLLSKPYTREALARKIRHVLSNQQQINRARLPAPQPTRPPEPASDQLTILLVEDELLIRMTTVDLLESLGHRVLEAGGATEALGLLAEHPVDLLLTDEGLPDLPGTELALRARATRPELALIFATGRDRLDALDKQPSLAGAVLLTKPYGEAQLAETLRRATGRGLSD